MKAKFNIKKLIKNIIILALVIAVVVLGVYVAKHKQLPSFYEITSIFRHHDIKEVVSSYKLNIDASSKTTIGGLKDNLVIADNMGTREYSKEGKEVAKNDIVLNNPIISSYENRFVIAESEGHKLYIYNGKDLVWQYEIEEKILKTDINKNGYVAVLFEKTGYKSGIRLFDNVGNVIYTKLFATTNVIDLSISPNNQYIATVEINTSDNKVNSVISYIGSNGEVVFATAEADIILSGVKFVDNNIAIAVGDNKIIRINKNGEKTILDEFQDKKMYAINVETGKYIIKAYRSATGVFANKTQIEIDDSKGKKIANYEGEGVVKSIQALGKTIARIIGDRIDFIDVSGRYIGSYTIGADLVDAVLLDNGGMAALQKKNEIDVVAIK